MRRKLIAGNWKMNGSLASNAELMAGITSRLTSEVKDVDVLVCVPFPYLGQIQTTVKDTSVLLGAQDVSQFTSGAYTGEVSVSMLKDFGCQYVIVGHSERRAYHGETNEIVASKACHALRAGLTPIVCVGETLAEREDGQMHHVIVHQIDAVLQLLNDDEVSSIVIAYEPVWAIGTGKTATPDMAQEVHALLRQQVALKNAQAALQVRILYGGSMKPDNAQLLMNEPDIDGGLIGGAALKADDFFAIIKAAV